LLVEPFCCVSTVVVVGKNILKMRKSQKNRTSEGNPSEVLSRENIVNLLRILV